MTWISGRGWQEATLSVSNIDRWLDDLKHLGRWRPLHRGPVGRQVLDYWRLSPEVTAEEAVIVAPEDNTRWLRLIRFDGAPEQTTIRGAAQPWDSGGLFSLLIHTTDIEAVYKSALELGWGSFNDIDVMHFGGRAIPNVVLRAPDGVCFGVYQFDPTDGAKSPPPTDFGMPFTSQQIVKDIDAARAFYEHALGWVSTYNGEVSLNVNQFGMPDNYKGAVPKNVSLIQAAADSWGRLELVEWTVFLGRDLAARAAPPNIGPLALRWCVDDLDSILDRNSQGPHYEPAVFDLAPFGNVRAAGLRTPDGALIDVIQVL